MTGTSGISNGKVIPAKAKRSAAKATNKGLSAKEKEAEGKILDFLFDLHLMGMDSAAEDEVLVQSGYNHIKSTGYCKVMNVLSKESCYLTKGKGKVSLTDKGLEVMQAKSSGGSNTPRTNKTLEEFYKKKIVKTYKKIPGEKLDIIWNLLSDREAHSASSLLEAAGYKHPKSTGFCAIVNALKACKLIVKEGKSCWKFDADKVFPYPE